MIVSGNIKDVYDCISGALNLKDCPAEKYIPIYLVVSGSVGIALGIIGVIHQKSK